MTEPPWTAKADDEQRRIDEQTAARMGITIEQLHEIDRQIEADTHARDALRPEERTLDGNPKFNKGFGPVTPANTIAPGELSAYYADHPDEPKL